MKRQADKYNNVVEGDIYKHYGLFFWQECLFCENEFRREKGYRFQLQYNRPWVYSCASCCSSKDEVNSKVGEMKKNRPKAPAAPPRKKPEERPDWLIMISTMKACSYCGVVAGACLSPDNCPKDKGEER